MICFLLVAFWFWFDFVLGFVVLGFILLDLLLVCFGMYCEFVVVFVLVYRLFCGFGLLRVGCFYDLVLFWIWDLFGLGFGCFVC